MIIYFFKKPSEKDSAAGVHVSMYHVTRYYISISSWSFSHIHSNKQKPLRRRTTWKHRYTVFLLPFVCFVVFI